MVVQGRSAGPSALVGMLQVLRNDQVDATVAREVVQRATDAARNAMQVPCVLWGIVRGIFTHALVFN